MITMTSTAKVLGPTGGELVFYAESDDGVRIRTTVTEHGDVSRLLISDELYRWVCDHGPTNGPVAQAGEGWMVINAANGTWRYRLLEYQPDTRKWLAERVKT